MDRDLRMENSTYNPDVLNCIANLSNDEVFTPPVLANQVLDMLPQELFASPKACSSISLYDYSFTLVHWR